ncbi:MAG TPA: hypothetical protein O0X39_00330 [Methanocorpusculum sp.]|nr:hypothetical protein [Methanocorpusculum sp.]
MNNPDSINDTVDRKKIYIGGAILLIIGIAVILIVFSGGAHIEAKSLTYNNGELAAVFGYDSDEPHKVWIQYRVFKVNGPFSTTEINGIDTQIATLQKGDTVSKFKLDLEPGEYKVFMYVIDFEDMKQRLAAFIRYINV